MAPDDVTPDDVDEAVAGDDVDVDVAVAVELEDVIVAAVVTAGTISPVSGTISPVSGTAHDDVTTIRSAPSKPVIHLDVTRTATGSVCPLGSLP